VSRTGLAKHRFLFRVRDWPQRTLPIRLPAGARAIQAFVDGRCLEGVQVDPEEGVLELPVPVRVDAAGSGIRGVGRSSLFEVVYTTGEPRWLWPWITLEAPLPALPAAPAAVQRRWRLPPDLAPLGSSRYRPVPGVGEALRGPLDRRLGLGDLFDPLPTLTWLQLGSTDLAVRRQTLADAAAGLRIRFQDDPGRPAGSGLRTLDDLVEELASGYLKSAHPLVLDRVALAEAGWHGQVSVAGAAPAPARVGPEVQPDRGLPGSDRGLAALVGHAGILLTTRQQVERWIPNPSAGGLFWFSPSREDLPAALEAPVFEAARNSQDSSGRFCSALTWLASGPPAPRETFQDADSGEIDDNWSSWSEWEEVPAGAEESSTLTAIHLESVTLAGLALGVGLVIGGTLLGRRRPEAPAGTRDPSSVRERTDSAEAIPHGAGERGTTKALTVRRLILLLWLALAGLALVWLPASLQMLAWWPLLFGLGFSLAVLLAWGFQTTAVRRAAPSQSGKSNPPSNRSSSGSSNKSAGSSGQRVLLMLVGIGLAAGASLARPSAGPTPTTDTVYLVPGPAEAPEKETVLAQPALLERLRDACRPAFAPTDAAVLLSAAYEGKLIDKVVEFQAVYQVQVLAPGGATLSLPLEGVQLLKDVLVDGARTLPVVASVRPAGAPEGGERTVYQLEVRGQGKHKVELWFRVPVTRGEWLRSFKFNAPRLPQNRMTLSLPADVAHVHVTALHGSQRLAREASGTRLELDLGSLAGPVQVFWIQEPGPPRKPRVEFREAWLWDLRIDASSLTGLLLWTISGAPVTSLELELPANLEVRSVEAQRAQGNSRDGPESRDRLVELPVRLRDWRVERSAAGPHRLLLELAAPVSGGVEVVLELVPRAPLAGTIALPLPRPLGEVTGLSYLAYRDRGEGLEVARPEWVGVRGILAPDFALFWPASSRPDPTGLVHFEFNRLARNLELRTQLRPQAFSVDATQEMEVKVGWARFADAARVHGPAWVESVALADVQANIVLQAPDGAPPVLSWEVPPSLTVASIAGPEVRRWTRLGNRVTVWLERGTGLASRLRKVVVGTSPVRLKLEGWLPLSSLPAKPPATPSQRLELACPRPLFPGKHSTRIHLETGPGLRLVEKKVRKLAATGSPSAHERSYESQDNDSEGTFEILATPSPRSRVVTRVEVQARRLEFTSTIEFWPPPVKAGPRAELQEVLVRVSGWPSKAMQLKAPAGTILRQHDHESPKVAGSPSGGRTGLVSVPARSPASTRVWWLELRPGQTGPYRLTLTGSLPRNESNGELFVPDVAVPSLNEEPVGTQSMGTSEAGGERWLTLVGDLEPAEVQGLEPDKLPADLAGGRVERGLVWKVKESNWQLHLPREVSPGDRASGRARLELLHTEHTAAVAGGRWLQEAVLWLRHDAHATLNLRWPSPVRILSVSLDGVMVTPADAHEDSAPPGTTTRLVSALPDRTEVCCLRVRWRGEGAEGSVDDPGLVWPRLEEDRGQVTSSGARTVWTVRVPPGWSLSGWGTRGPAEQSDPAVPSVVSGSARWALVELGRARVELERSRLLVEHPAEKGNEVLLAAQTRFYQAGLHLEQAIDATPARLPARRVLDSLGVRASWRELREQNQNLTSGSRFKTVRERAERQARAAGRDQVSGEVPSAEERLPREGVPISWQTPANQESASPLLTPERVQQSRQALVLSGQWLFLLALGMVLGLSAGLRTLTRWLAPELLGLVGVFGWQLAGPTLVVMFLLALAGAARLILLLRIVPRVPRLFGARPAIR
jgi:hypothetical protein